MDRLSDEHLKWLELRKKGIGGSDASVVVGLNKWKSPFELWLEKTGEATTEITGNEAMYFGNLLEDLVAKEFEKRTGKKVRRKNSMIYHPDHEFIFANVDRMIVGEKAVLECKTTSAYNAKEWEDGKIPEQYMLQIQHYLGVLGQEYKIAYIACLIGGNKFVWYEVPRDDELIECIFEQEVAFWQKFVQTGTPPILDGSSSAEKFIKQRFERSETGKSIDLKSDWKDEIEQLIYLENQHRTLDEQIKKIKNSIKYELKEAEIGCIDKYEVHWKTIVSNRVDSKLLKKKYPNIFEKVTKESVSRRFEIKNKGA